MGGVDGLLGREDEQRRLGGLLGGARNGRGGSLLIVGEPGIGKSALLHVTPTAAPGVRWLRLDGFESESTIPFAGIQRLLLPLKDLLPALQARQRRAIEVASGIADDAPPDR